MYEFRREQTSSYAIVRFGTSSFAIIRFLSRIGERYCETMLTIATLCEVGDRLRSIAKERETFGIFALTAGPAEGRTP